LAGEPRSHIGRLTPASAATQTLELNACGTEAYWNRDGAVPEVDEISTEYSLDGMNFTTLRYGGMWKTNGWRIRPLSLPCNQLFYLRVRGRVIGGRDDSSRSLIESVRQCLVVQTNPPTITLHGGNPLVVWQHSTFVDPGATAADQCGGDLSSGITVGGDGVDTEVLGDYVLTYSVFDNCGNPASVERTVQVVEPPVPDLSVQILSIVITNSGGPMIMLHCHGITNAQHSLRISANLMDWTTLTNVISDSEGFFDCFDYSGPAETARFYRLWCP
jgi:hypothetical protein